MLCLRPGHAAADAAKRQVPGAEPRVRVGQRGRLFFAGALAHGKDYKRSAGGFIHGLRYTARCLFRILEARYEAEPWPAQVRLSQSTAAVDWQKVLQSTAAETEV